MVHTIEVNINTENIESKLNYAIESYERLYSHTKKLYGPYTSFEDPSRPGVITFVFEVHDK